MNVYAEFCRLWKESAAAVTLLPVEKIFTGRVPDKIEDPKTGKDVDVNPPFVSIYSFDGDVSGGTSRYITQIVVVQFSAFAGTHSQAVALRDFARDFFENAELTLGDQPTERFEDISIADSGEADEEDGIFQAFQRFNVEVSISRPKKRKV